jgi:hypothetical protein
MHPLRCGLSFAIGRARSRNRTRLLPYSGMSARQCSLAGRNASDRSAAGKALARRQIPGDVPGNHHIHRPLHENSCAFGRLGPRLGRRWPPLSVNRWTNAGGPSATPAWVSIHRSSASSRSIAACASRSPADRPGSSYRTSTSVNPSAFPSAYNPALSAG